MPKIDGKILVLDADQSVIFTSKMVLKDHFEKVVTETDSNKLDQHLEADQFDVVVLDMNFSYGLTRGQEGIKLLKKVLAKDPKAHVLMNTSYGDTEIAMEALNAGAIDYLIKPWSKEKLLATVKSIYALSQSKKEIEILKGNQSVSGEQRAYDLTEVPQKSVGMKSLMGKLERVAKDEINLLISGEYGTDKGLIARKIHKSSSRKDGNFIHVDLRSLEEKDFEKELFGYDQGAFPGANSSSPGRFEMANKGTLYLEEIGALSPSLQAKLITAIQFMQISRVGSDKSINIDTRLICSSSKPLKAMVDRNEFRQELFSLINSYELTVPPLSERREDIELLVRNFLKLFGKKYQKSKMRLNATTLEKLVAYHWPGNTRELQVAVERAVLMSASPLLAPEDFLFSESSSNASVESEDLNMEHMEKFAIQSAIRKAEGNLTKAAKTLGLGRSTLYRKMEKYKL